MLATVLSVVLQVLPAVPAPEPEPIRQSGKSGGLIVPAWAWLAATLAAFSLAGINTAFEILFPVYGLRGGPERGRDRQPGGTQSALGWGDPPLFRHGAGARQADAREHRQFDRPGRVGGVGALGWVAGRPGSDHGRVRLGFRHVARGQRHLAAGRWSAAGVVGAPDQLLQLRALRWRYHRAVGRRDVGRAWVSRRPSC